MSRMAVISDIHGNLPALTEVVADLNGRKVDMVVNLGDHLSGPLWPKETIEFLMEQPWVHILGNMDTSLVHQAPEFHGLSDAYAFRVLDPREKEWLRALPETRRVDKAVLAFHGTPSNNAQYLLESIERNRVRLATLAEIETRLGETRSPVMLCGHSHVQRVVETGDDTMIINPGSVGLPAYTDDQPEQHSIECGSPHARYAILDMRKGRCVVQFVAVPYDSRGAAEQARRNKREDWAVALESGFIAR